MLTRYPKILLTIAALLLLQEGRALAYWDCYGNWEAWTNRREMRGATNFECKGSYAPWPGKCGDWSHTAGNTWVDILGGISQSCQDHSDTFFGPLSGEWNGCKSSSSTQSSDGRKDIAGINQWWDRWPGGTYNGPYDPWTLNGYIGATFFMRDPYASVYDLDTCSIVQDVGTIFWGNFAIQSQLIAGHPLDTGAGYVAFEFSGSAGLNCSGLEDECQTVVCADLSVRKQLNCVWVEPSENFCGNGVCDSGEDCNNCFGDCAQICPP
jgi:hypothetical protein